MSFNDMGELNKRLSVLADAQYTPQFFVINKRKVINTLYILMIEEHHDPRNDHQCVITLVTGEKFTVDRTYQELLNALSDKKSMV